MIASLAGMVLGCGEILPPTVEPSPTLLEPPPPAPVERVWAELPAEGASTPGDLHLFWPADGSLIRVQREGVELSMVNDVIAWSDPMPSGQRVQKIEGLVPKDAVDEIRRLVRTLGAPQAVPPVLIEIPLRVLPDQPLGRVELMFEGRGPSPGQRGRQRDLADELGIPPEKQHRGGYWSTGSWRWLVKLEGNQGTFAIYSYQEQDLRETLARADFARVLPTDQPDKDDDILEMDAVVSDGIEEGDPVRIVWPDGIEPEDADMKDGAFAYAGRDERGWAKIRGLRWLRHLQSMRAEVGRPPTLVPDERVALVIPLKSTPNPKKMTQTTSVTDGDLQSPDFPYLSVGNRSITLLVPPQDVAWMQHWLKVSGGRLALTPLRGLMMSGGVPPPPGFPPNTRLRRGG